MDLYQVGEIAHITASFTDAAGTPLNPAVVKFHYRAPNGTETTLTYPTGIIKPSTGNYYYDLALSAAGDWFYRWESTGSGAAAEIGLLVVEKTPL